MKGSTNAMRGSADVVQNKSSISILDTTIQNSTDSQPGLMSAADHQQMTADHATLSTTVSRVSTCESDIAGKQNKLTFDAVPTEGSSNPVTSGGVYSAITSSGSKVSKYEFGHPVISDNLKIVLDLGNFTFRDENTHFNYTVGTSTVSDSCESGFERDINNSKLYFDKESCEFKWGLKYDYKKTSFPKIYKATWDSSTNGNTWSTSNILESIGNRIENSIIGKYSYRFYNTDNPHFSRNTTVDTSIIVILIDDNVVCYGRMWCNGNNNSISAVGASSLVGSLTPNTSFELGYRTTHNVKVGYASCISDYIEDYSAGYTSIPSSWTAITDL